MIIEIRDQQIEDLLRSSYLLIPRFQRPYSWNNDNVEEFWNDILSENIGDYFIGTFVVYKDRDCLAIVDGQQRVSTCIILLSCIRDELKANNKKDLAEGLHELIERRDINYKKRFTLTTESSYPYFQHKIMSNNIDSSHHIDIGPEEKLIAQTRDIFKSKLEIIVDSIKEDRSEDRKKVLDKIENTLLKIRDKILKLRFIKIELGTEDDAYIIFETLNTRGKDLSVTDMVKNFITRNLLTRNSDNDPAKIKWNKILETIDGSGKNINTSTFLHHYWLSKYDYVTIKKLFKQIKDSFTTKPKVGKFLNDLVHDSETYRSIFDLSFRQWRIEEKSLEDYLYALEIFKVRQQIPMVLSVLRKYNSNEYSLKNVNDILRAIVNFHFIFTAVTSQRSSGGISQMYASSARNFESAHNEQERRKICNTLKQKLKEKIPSYKEFEANFSEIEFTKNLSKQKDIVKYILYKYNQFLSKSYSEDKEILTIEHILSQDKINKMTGQIGNLILINKISNESLGNKSFEKKKQFFISHNILIDQNILKAKKWNEEEIENRTTAIAKIGYHNIWKI